MTKHKDVVMTGEDLQGWIWANGRQGWGSNVGDEEIAEHLAIEKHLVGTDYYTDDDGVMQQMCELSGDPFTGSQWWRVSWPEHVLCPSYNSDATYHGPFSQFGDAYEVDAEVMIRGFCIADANWEWGVDLITENEFLGWACDSPGVVRLTLTVPNKIENEDGELEPDVFNSAYRDVGLDEAREMVEAGDVRHFDDYARDLVGELGVLPAAAGLGDWFAKHLLRKCEKLIARVSFKLVDAPSDHPSHDEPWRDSIDCLFQCMKNRWHNLPEWDDLPTFGGTEPDDTSGVWSWNKTRMIVGDCPDDIEIVNRDEWEAGKNKA